jgi:hypothetical protein
MILARVCLPLAVQSFTVGVFHFSNSRVVSILKCDQSAPEDAYYFNSIETHSFTIQRFIIMSTNLFDNCVAQKKSIIDFPLPNQKAKLESAPSFSYNSSLTTRLPDYLTTRLPDYPTTRLPDHLEHL